MKLLYSRKDYAISYATISAIGLYFFRLIVLYHDSSKKVEILVALTFDPVTVVRAEGSGGEEVVL